MLRCRHAPTAHFDHHFTLTHVAMAIADTAPTCGDRVQHHIGLKYGLAGMSAIDIDEDEYRTSGEHALLHLARFARWNSR
jgi:hypothetical protein